MMKNFVEVHWNHIDVEIYNHYNDQIIDKNFLTIYQLDNLSLIVVNESFIDLWVRNPITYYFTLLGPIELPNNISIADFLMKEADLENSIILLRHEFYHEIFASRYQPKRSINIALTNYAINQPILSPC